VFVIARVIRTFASGAQLALTLDLPIPPAAGMWLALPGAGGPRDVEIERVTLDVTDGTWTPGAQPVRVHVETATESADAEASAREYGWKPLGLMAAVPASVTNT
jgi:hypothetical protein